MPSLLIQSLVSLALQGDKSEVDSLPPQQVIVLAPLHSSAVLKADNHISVLDRGQPVSDRDGGATHAYLWRNASVILGTRKNNLDILIIQILLDFLWGRRGLILIKQQE